MRITRTSENPYFQGTMQMVGGCTEAVVGGVAVFTGAGTVPGVLALAHGTDLCGTGFTTLVAGETQETLFFQTVSAGLEMAGLNERRAAVGATARDLAVGVGAPLAIGRAQRVSRLTGEVIEVDPATLRWSQTSAGGGGRASSLRTSLGEHGWVGDPIDVVKTVDGLVTVDHTRGRGGP